MIWNRLELPVQAHIRATNIVLPVRGVLARLVPALVISLLLFVADGVAQAPAAQPEAVPGGIFAAALSQGRFLARRSWQPGGMLDRRISASPAEAVLPLAGGNSTATWTALGPAAIVTPHYGLVSGRVTSIAIDPADATGNHVYIGTTGGGVWAAQNAASSTVSQIVFQPLTDNLSALGGAWDASISIGALTAQPGGTGVVLAGTGDPNDATDSYYGAGVLRSTDSGSTWSLIARTTDMESSLSLQNFSFAGEGFAGFAWSTVNPQVVVAAVSQAYEGTLVNAVTAQSSTQGLYYSTDSGLSWHLATISDSGANVQGPLDRFPSPDGNAATAVVWNPVRKLFFAAVRYHGYYKSTDGITWTRLANQPGAGLAASKCPTNSGSTGSIACPIYRGALAVNPVTGDMFAWTVDANNQDQGLWQDLCALTGGVCTNQTISFGQQWPTAALETSTMQGSATIANGVYTLALAAVPVPNQQAVEVFAGATDLWQTACPVSLGCTWRNTTNANTCHSAAVGPFQHALAFHSSNANELFVGNDSGLWRSMDLIAETGSVCAATDATHFQNLNGQLQNKDGSAGSLAEPTSISAVLNTPYTLLAGFGVNGAAGVKANAVTANWPQVLGGYGGPVGVDPNISSNWYVNDQSGVAIYQCTQSAACTPADFGTSPVVGSTSVGGDGAAMSEPAPFLLDPLDSSQLIVGTCRVWRGAASGQGWASTNAVSPILDTGATTGACAGDTLIRTLAAAQLTATTEVLYAGTYGSANGGGLLPGHILSATYDSSTGTMPTWHDLTLNPVGNNSHRLNYYGFDISSISIDAHSSGTIYVTVEAAQQTAAASVQTVYRSTDSGATWNSIMANLPNSPVSTLVVDPGNANTVYVATDQGVYYTTAVATCATAQSKCWSAFGSGMPQAPVVALSAAPQTASSKVLVAATYGRGIWQTALVSSGSAQSAASVSPSSLSFPSTTYGTTSAALSVTLTNTSQVALTPTSISMSGNAQDFNAAGCTGQTVAAGASCTIQVTFTPAATGSRTAVMTIFANVYGGQLIVDLNGTGLAGGSVSLTPSSLSFGSVQNGATSATQPAQLTNLGAAVVTISNVSVTQPFVLASNSCAATLATNSACQVTVAFAPVQAGQVSGLLTFTSSAGTQAVQLNGTGAAGPTDTLSESSLTFASTSVGQVSSAQAMTITNVGDLPLTVSSITASANFQQSSNCLSGVAAGTACSVWVAFAPTAAGVLTGTLTIVDAVGTKTVSLNGTGLQPGTLTVIPSSLTFTNQQAGVASAPQTVTITNSGGSSIASIGFQLSGAAAAQYSVGATTCGAQLNAGASCTVQVSFTPAGTGTISAALNISSATAGVSAVQVQLNGSGNLVTGLTLSPSLLTFATAIAVGQASSAQMATVTNSTGFAIGTVSVATAAPFSISTNGCTGQLSAGASCTLGIVFQPTASGSANGTLTVTSSVVTTPATATLTGAGYDFTVAPSGSSSSTVSSGQAANYRLTLTPIGAQGSFTFACGTLPANSICIFNPATTTLSAGVQGNVLVQVYTGSSLAMRGEPVLFGSRWPIALALLALPFALLKRRRLLLVVLLALVAVCGISSCTAAIGGTKGTDLARAKRIP